MALLSTTLLVICAFAADFGMAYVSQRNLQNGVDAAALAAGNALVQSYPKATCNAMTTASAIASARSVAQNYFSQNVPESTAQILAGSDGFDISCTNGNKDVLVSVNASQSSPSVLGRLANVKKIPVGESAKVMVGPPGEVVGLRPFALCKAQADLLTSTVNTVMTFSFDNSDGGCGSAPGAFGLLDLDGSVSGGSDDLKVWVKNGYDGVPPNFGALLGEGGNEFGSLPISEMMGKKIALPVYDSIQKITGKTYYHGVGYVTVTACAWGSSSTPDFSASCFDSANWSSALTKYGSGKHLFQVKYVNFTPVADLSGTCALGDPDCDFGPRVVKLAD